jgi:hypothetical protein
MTLFAEVIQTNRMLRTLLGLLTALKDNLDDVGKFIDKTIAVR